MVVLLHGRKAFAAHVNRALVRVEWLIHAVRCHVVRVVVNKSGGILMVVALVLLVLGANRGRLHCQTEGLCATRDHLLDS